ncbi:MFS transporter [Nonomuraea lactucae]|uniref:MFS transporter n=1 Tax=Nonomuraea lactucae TaxID=2249762 RepID=UPI000DE3337F|nr:MFS transporter [Nonomuraea lactucae]
MNDDTRTAKRGLGPVARAALIGSALEWYDFSLYATATAVVFNKIMFPSTDPTVATILSFGTFAIGFLARPLGGIVFGHFGDRIGRKRVLLLTLMLMGSATTLIGLVPSYASVGILAPISLVALRILQGLGAGAEFGGAAILSVEHAHPRRRGIQGSWTAVGVFAGLVLASLTFTLLLKLPQDAFLSWGWRVPFLASALIVGFALVLRFRLAESPDFDRMAKNEAIETFPLKTLVRTQGKPLAVVMATQAGQSAVSYVYLTFIIAYAIQQLKLSPGIATLAVSCAAGAAIVTMPLFGALSDRIGRKTVILGGMGFSAAFAFPFFAIADQATTAGVIVAMMIGVGIGTAATLAPTAAFFTELFPPQVRYSGLGLGRELAGALSGGLAPTVAAALVAGAGGSSTPVALLLVIVSLVAMVVVALGPETLPSVAATVIGADGGPGGSTRTADTLQRPVLRADEA